ncbi:hypothetical protein A5728_02885 [Kocuria sp. ICS0012]|nr:hypothetical protein A5728_02885 [Kocuria sp. ICS0012]
MLAASESFFTKTLGTEDEKEQLRERIAQLQSQLDALDGPRADAAEDVATMKNLGLSNKEIAELLELSTARVGQYLKLSPVAAESQERSQTAGGAESIVPA